ncbi:MAG TPA: hypothetical protein VIP05_24690 [Burkholderiaceae bacterium]
MEQNTASTPSYDTNEATTEPTPFPVAGQAASATAGGAADAARRHDPGAAASAAPVVDNLLKRVTQSAHAAVDGVSERIASTMEGLQGGASRVGDTRDEWVESAREAIRQHPLAALGGAVLVGLALHSLLSSRDR